MLKKRIILALFFSVLFITFISIKARADILTVEVQASADTFIKEGSKNSNEGDKGYVRIQNGNISNVLIAFDTNDILAAVDGRPLVSAYLQMYLETNWTNWGSGSLLNLYRLSSSWTEMGATWNCANDTNILNDNPDCGTLWNGGIYVSTPSSTILQTNNSIGPQLLSVTEDLQTVLTGGYNYGWLLKKENYANTGSADYGSVQGVTEHRPKLIIEVEDDDVDIDGAGKKVWMYSNTGSPDYAIGLFGSNGNDCSSFGTPDDWFGTRTQNLNVFMFQKEMVSGVTCPSCNSNNFLWNFRSKKAFCKVDSQWEIAIASAAITTNDGCTGNGEADVAKNAIKRIQCNSNTDTCCECGPSGCTTQPKNCSGAGGTVSYVAIDSALFDSYYRDNQCDIPNMNNAALVVKNFRQIVSGSYSVQFGMIEPWHITAMDQKKEDQWNNSISILTQWVDTLIANGIQPDFFILDVDPKKDNLQGLEADLNTLKSYLGAKSIPFGVLYYGGEGVNATNWYNNAMNVVQKTKSAINIPEINLFMDYSNPPVTNNLPECSSNSLTRTVNDGWSHLKNKTKKSIFNSQSANAGDPIDFNTTRDITMTFTNSGKTTWQYPSTTDGSYYYLVYSPITVDPPCPIASNNWGQPGQIGVPIPSNQCGAPGRQITFGQTTGSFRITSPPSSQPAGTYQFRWRLAKEDSNGNVTLFGAPSPTLCVQVGTGTTPPAAPTLTSPANGSVTTATPLLTWNSLNPAPTNYEVEIRKNSGGTLIDNPSLPGSQSNYQVPAGKLTAGITYKWRCRGKNAGGNGSWSGYWTFTVQSTQTFVMVDMGSPDSEQGLWRPSSEPGDGETVATTITTGGSCSPPNNSVSLRKNRGISSPPTNDLYFYFQVDNNFINGTPSTAVDIEVQYYSKTLSGEPTQFCLQYKKSDGNWAPNICETVGNTTCMKTRVFSNIPNAYFGGTLPGSADFRIWTGGSGNTADTRRYINTVKVVKH